MGEAYYVLEIQPIGGSAETREIHAAVVLIGRKDGDILIQDKGASSRHAEIRFDGRTVTVADVGSTNGTLFEGSLRKDPFGLPPGSGFQIGLTRFRLLALHKAEAPGSNGEEEEPTSAGSPNWDLMAHEEGGLATSEAPALKAAAPAAPPARSPVAVSFPEPTPPPVEKTAFLETDDLGMAMDVPPAAAAPASRGVAAGSAPAPEKTAFLETELAPALTPEVLAGYRGPEDDSAVLLGDQAGKTAFIAATVDIEELSEPDKTAFVTEREDDGPPPARAQISPRQTGDRAAAPRPAAVRRETESWAEAAPEPEPAPAPQRPRTATVQVAVGEGVRPWFSGTGGEVFRQMIVGALLTGLTFGIYLPWFMVRLRQWLASRVVVGPTRHGNVQLVFTGSGAQLFVKAFVGYLLTLITLGIYGFWFAVDLIRFFHEHTEGHAEDGTVYQVRFTLTGGAFFGNVIVGYLLTLVTLGIYAPWFICSARRLVDGHTFLFENGRHVGGAEFVGEGGSLFGTFVVGYVLTLLTLGIYGAWFQASLWRWFATNSRVHHDGRVFQGAFYGTGGELFLIGFVSFFLLPLTLGIYGFWLYARLKAFKTNNTVYHPVAYA